MTADDALLSASSAVPASDGPELASTIDREIDKGQADFHADLQPLTAELLESVSVADVVRVVVERGVAVLGARAGLVALVTPEGREIEIVQTRGFRSATTAAWTRMRMDAPLPLTDVVRTGEPLYLGSRAAWEEYYPEVLKVAEAAMQASVTLPLTARHKTLGGIHFSFAQPRAFTVSERIIIDELARQCALSLDRALLLKFAEEGRKRHEFRARASALLTDSPDYQARLEALARLCVPELADWSGVDILDENGTLIRLAVAHRDPSCEPLMRELQRRYPPNPQQDRGSFRVSGLFRHRRVGRPPGYRLHSGHSTRRSDAGPRRGGPWTWD